MLLRELLQFDCADLDFGIYRIMNRRRDVIGRFIAQDPPKSVAKELDRGTLADQSRAAKELKEVAEQIAQALGKKALEILGSEYFSGGSSPSRCGKSALTLIFLL